MKNYLLRLAIVAAAFAGANGASAQVVVEGNGARADGHWGAELGAGYNFGTHGFHLTPMIGAFLYHHDDGRYEMYNNGGNSQACHNTTNGQYADKANCAHIAVRAYGRLEATYTVPMAATFGAGVRIGDEVKPYGTVAVSIAPKVKMKGDAGPGYYALGLHLGL